MLQTACKGYQQTTLLGKEFKLNPSFGSDMALEARNLDFVGHKPCSLVSALFFHYLNIVSTLATCKVSVL